MINVNVTMPKTAFAQSNVQVRDDGRLVTSLPDRTNTSHKARVNFPAAQRRVSSSQLSA